MYRDFDFRLPNIKQGTLRSALKGVSKQRNHNPQLIPTESPEWLIAQRIKPGQKLSNVRGGDNAIATWDIPEVFGRVSETQRCILETIGRHRRHKRYGSITNGNPLPEDEIMRLTRIGSVRSDLEVLEGLGYVKHLEGGWDLKGALFCSGLFKRPAWDSPAPTVLTNFHNPRYFVHPTRNRPFSVRECARLQGFDDNFNFLGESYGVSIVDKYRLVGNAVPPPLARALAIQVGQTLDRKATK